MAALGKTVERRVRDDELVQMSGLIAEIKVLDVGDAPKESLHPFTAQVEVTRSFRGAARGETVELRFDASVQLRQGEEYLLFARRRLEGSYTPLTQPRSWSSATARRIEQLCQDHDYSVAFQRTSRTRQDDDPELRLTIENRGRKSFRIHDHLSVKVQSHTFSRRRGGLARAERPTYQGLPVTLLIEASGGVRFLQRLQRVRSPLLIEPDEGAEAVFRLSELLPNAHGEGELRMWALVGGKLSGPVSASVDFGHAGPGTVKQSGLSSRAASEGPFRKFKRYSLAKTILRQYGWLICLVLLGLIVWCAWRARRARPRAAIRNEEGLA